MDRKLIIAIDSGATKTTCAIVNDKGDILGLGLAGSSSHYSVGVKRAQENFRSAIEKATESAKLNKTIFDVGCFGLSALDTQSDYELNSTFITSLGITKKAVIVSDAVTSYYAVTAGEPGIVVIAGTGSVAYGINRKGEEARSGGWEWLISDEGSAYDIARKGVRAALRAYDGRGKDTILTKMVMEYFNVSTFEESLQKIYENPEKSTIASMAPIVTSAAQKGDLVALNILREAGKELGLAVVAVAKKLKMEKDRIFVGCMGGVFRSDKFILNPFKRTVKSDIPKAIFKPPIYNAISGAIFLGLKEDGLPINKELVSRIEGNLNTLLQKM